MAKNKTAPPPKVARKTAKVAFPKKAQAPSEAEFIARLPVALGKRFESVRAFLKKQKDVAEEMYYYGPKTGWAWRYRRNGAQPVCSIMIHDQRLIGIVALDASAQAAVSWDELSPVAQRARRGAHGSPSLLWVDLPFEGPGATDFKALLKAKLRALAV
jgi:hypothetical protein